MTGFPDDRPDGSAAEDGERGKHGESGRSADRHVPGDRGPFGDSGAFGDCGGLGDPEGPGAPGSLDGTFADPLEPLLRSPAPFLSAPPGSFERIRRRAARRRRVRAALGGSAAVAVTACAFYLAGSLQPGGGSHVVGPPASSLRDRSPSVATPAPTTPPPPAGGSAGSPEVRPTPPPSPSGTATSPASPVHSGASPTPTGGGASPDDTPPGTTPMCTAAQLSAALGGGDAGAGNLYRYLVLTNTSTTTCHLTGFPGLSMLDASGRQIGAPASREHDGYTPVVLKPGDTASDTIHTINQQGTCLPTSVRLRIYPPGSKASLVFPGEITNCDDLFAITPLIAGSTGNPPS